MENGSLQVSKDGRWSYTAGRYGVLQADISLEIDGHRRTAADTDCRRMLRRQRDKSAGPVLTIAFPGGQVSMDVTFACIDDHVLISGKVTNRGRETVRLGKCCLLDLGSSEPDCRIEIGPGGDRLTFLATDGWCSVSEVVRFMITRKALVSKTAGHLYNPDSGVGLISSFLTFDRMNTEIRLDADKDRPLRHYRACCDFDGYELLAGNSVATETLYVGVFDDPFKSLTDWADAVARHYRPKLWKKPPVGWVGWAWQGAEEPHERIVLRNAKAVRERLAGFDVDYVWISITNIERGLPGNWLKTNRANYPRGLEPVIRTLSKRHFKTGLWMAPFWVCPLVKDQVECNKDNLLRMADGSLAVNYKKWPYGESAALPPSERPDFWVLDGSHPNTTRYLTEIFREYRRMGVRYYMLDFVDAGSGSTPGRCLYDRYHNRRMIKGPEVYRNAMKAIQKAVGPDTYLLTSTGPTFQNIGLVHAVRTGVDFGEGRAPVKGSWFFPATMLLGGGENSNYMAALQNMAANFFAHGRWYFNDSGNLLTVDKPLPLNIARIHASVFAVCGGPMMLGDDIGGIDPERLKLIKLCLPRSSQVAVPVDLFTACAPGSRPRVFRLHIRKPWGEYVIVAIFNDRKRELTRILSARDLGLPEDEPCQVYDFWNQSYLGEQTGQFEFVVAGQSVGLYRIQRRLTHPWLLSTDMHILQGKEEIADLHWHPRKLELSGTACRPKGESGNLFVIAPPGWKPLRYKGLWVMKHAWDQTIIVRKRLEFTTDQVKWSIPFERT